MSNSSDRFNAACELLVRKDAMPPADTTQDLGFTRETIRLIRRIIDDQRLRINDHPSKATRKAVNVFANELDAELTLQDGRARRRGL